MNLPRTNRPISLRTIAFLILFAAMEALAPEPLPAEDGAAGVRHDSSDEITVAAVQFEVSEERYGSISRLHAEIDRLVAEARRRYDADIVVFPEYINVFLLASRYPGVVATSDGLFEALAQISDEPVNSDTVAQVLHSEADIIADTAVAMWSDIADRHDTTIVAGTLFALVEPQTVDDAERELHNRLLVFDEDGNLSYTQDKVYLTPVDSDLLGLEPGSIDAAATLVVEGLEIGFTICRDGYFRAWNRRLGGIDLWISVRANGEPYTREVYERFLTAMPERVAETEADAGISASLTGAFLGEVWAGPSYVVDESGNRIAASDRPVGTQITAVRMVREPANVDDHRSGRWQPRPVVPTY